ncbi:MAG: ABC transporter permease [Thermoplasmata archaeon]
MGYGLTRYVFRRIIYLVITVILILSFNFLLFRIMPGDIENILFPKGASSETKAELAKYYGLDKSLPEQYYIYLKQTFSGEFGKSITVYKGSAIESVLGPFLLNTLILVGSGTVISIWVGVILGRQAAWKRGKLADRLGSSFFIVFYCMPTFLFALILLVVFAKYVPGWPISGAYSDYYNELDIFGRIADRGYHTLVPLFALIIETIATFSIITRSSLIDVMTEDYIKTAVAKGMRSYDVLHGHAMPNAMLPVVTVVAMNVGWVVSGSIMIEMIFSYQGLGYLTWRAVVGYDYPLLQALFMLEALAVVIANFIADLAILKMDPRVRI